MSHATHRLVALGVLALAVSFGLVLAEAQPTAPRALLAVAFSPLVVALLILAGRDWLPTRRPHLAAALVGGCHLVASLAAGRFDPYALAIVVALAWFTVSASPRDPAGIAAVWLVLWIPFDLRWFTRDLWPGPPELAYAWWSLVVSLLAVLAFPDVDWRLPRARDVKVGLFTLLAFGAFAIPVGLAVGFLAVPHLPKHTAVEVAGIGLGYLLLVAVPEELFFRGVLDRELSKTLGPRSALLLSSLAFGLMHWNNANKLGRQLSYCALATVAGVFYAVAFRRAGLPASILTHALVDTVWKACLR